MAKFTVPLQRQLLEATRFEFEAERKEMFNEISLLEVKSSELSKSLLTSQADLSTMRSKLDETENELGYIANESNAQKIEIATLSEREKQLKLQLSEKDQLLEKAEKREANLQATISELSNKNK